MSRRAKYVILGGLVSSIWGVSARADVPKQPDASTNAAPTPPTVLTDADIKRMAEQGETVEIFDERPDKPFDRDTEVRLTGEQLAARGAVDLGTALSMIPDVTVRDAGRGGFNVDIRGGRKGEVAVIIDGVLVTDPYYGTFDVSTIPITDIVQIRISTTPQNPIDGPGGSGGVIEVLTRDAMGPQIVMARMTGDTLPSFTAAATARTELTKHLALRLSASGLMGSHDYTLVDSLPEISEQRRAATGATRLEYREGNRRIAVDGFVDDRHYIPPPADQAISGFLVIDRETTERASAKLDDKYGNVQVQVQGWVHHLFRRSRNFMDPTLSNVTNEEDLSALRTGGLALATQPISKDWRWAASTTVDNESAHDTTLGRVADGNTTLVEPAGDLQFEHGRVRADAGFGVALPFGAPNADAWPEGKLDVKVRATDDLRISATFGRKGRVPSLRERFDPAQGNPMLGPEKVWHSEVRAIEQIDDRVRLEVAPFYRAQSGTIKADPLNKGIFSSLGDLDVYGVDAIGRVRVHPMIELGGGYDFIRAKSATSPDAIDRLPRNKVEGWVQATPDSRVAVLARAKYYGRSTDGVNADNTQHYVSGYTIVEASASAQITKQYLAVLRVDDLLNKRPETRAGFTSDGRVIMLVIQGMWE